VKIRIRKETIAIFKHNKKIYAIQNNCPHQNAELVTGYIKNNKIYCALHHWAFDIESGAYAFNPKMFLKTYEVQIKDEIVYIGIEQIK